MSETVWAWPAFFGLMGAARADITPPVGIYARNWGAATHDTAEGIHRPLTATVLTLQAAPNAVPQVLLSLDLGWWRDKADERFVREGILHALPAHEADILLCLTHTHAGPSVCRADLLRPGGAWVGAYLNRLRETVIAICRAALENARPATLTVAQGACRLAVNRDLPHPATPHHYLTGFNPSGPPADNTLLVGRVTDDSTGETIATVVNYACHPTTLGPSNRLISPDFVGAMRDIIEPATDTAPCLFLQGASGELAPRVQYTADVSVAEAHGRSLGYAALSCLAGLPPAKSLKTALRFVGEQSSGAPLGLWEPAPAARITAPFQAERLTLPLMLKHLPDRATLVREREQATDTALRERLLRRLQVREYVGDGNTCAYPLYVWQMGNVVFVAHPGEAYSALQTQLRAMLPEKAVFVVNVANGWYGYLPPEALYATDAYAASQTPFTSGCLEQTVAALKHHLEGES